MAPTARACPTSRLRPVRRRGLPRPGSYPLRDPAGLTGAEAAARAIDPSRRRWAPSAWPRRGRAHPGRGRLRGPGARSSPEAVGCAGPRLLFGPTRSRPASPHRRLVRLRPRGRRPRPDRHGEGHRRRAAAGRGHRPGGPHGRGAPGRPGRHVRRQPGGLRGGAGALEALRAWTWARPGDRGLLRDGSTLAENPGRRRIRAAARCSRSRWCCRAPRAGRRPRRRLAAACDRPAWWCSRAARGARGAPAAAPDDRRPLLEEALDVLEQAFTATA